MTEDQVKAHYEQLKAGLGAREFKLRVMLLPNAVRAKDVRAELAKGKDFAELARQWSLAPSATRGGELSWISFKTPPQEGQTSGLPLPIAAAVDKLQKGKVSEPIEVQGKFWVVKLDDVRPVKVPPFEETRQDIFNYLSAQELERATTAAGPAAERERKDRPLGALTRQRVTDRGERRAGRKSCCAPDQPSAPRCRK